jgi:hypothetical protein
VKKLDVAFPAIELCFELDDAQLEERSGHPILPSVKQR